MGNASDQVENFVVCNCDKCDSYFLYHCILFDLLRHRHLWPPCISSYWFQENTGLFFFVKIELFFKFVFFSGCLSILHPWFNCLPSLIVHARKCNTPNTKNPLWFGFAAWIWAPSPKIKPTAGVIQEKAEKKLDATNFRQKSSILVKKNELLGWNEVQHKILLICSWRQSKFV